MRFKKDHIAALYFILPDIVHQQHTSKQIFLYFTLLQRCGHAISPKLHTYPTTFSRNFCRKHHHNRRQREKTRMKMFFLTTIRVHKAGFWGLFLFPKLEFCGDKLGCNYISYKIISNLVFLTIRNTEYCSCTWFYIFR